ncbi:MAG: glycosyltransferase family 39 protein [Chloroflexi bacterium]|nr:glycosyltransferase family 39 protein [Chloroflexota bacterium]
MPPIHRQNQANQARPKFIVWAMLWLIIFVLALAWRSQNLAAFGLSNDEGAHLMWAKLAVDGYPLYSQTYAVQPPLFLETVGLAFRLAGRTIQVGRWAILPGFGLLALSLSWLAYRSGGWLSALVALLLLSLSPLIFTFSRLVMAEVPATTLAVTSVVLLFLYLVQNRKIWLLASGLVLGLSFITKALNPFVVAPMLLLWQGSGGGGQGLGVRGEGSVVGGPTGRLRTQHSAVGGREFLFDSLVWGLGVVIPLVAVLLIYDPVALYDQLIRFRSDLRAVIPGSTPETIVQFRAFFISHWGFWLLAFGSIMAAVVRAWAEKQQGRNFSLSHLFTDPLSLPLVWTVWLMAGVVMLWWHTPLFPHHFIVLLPPLILLGADLITHITLSQRGSEATSHNLSSSFSAAPSAARIALAVIVVVAAFNIPAMVKANQETAAIVTGGREAEALELLKAVSAPDDFIMGDSQLLIFMAGRRTPPPLGDVALVAIKAGRQTSSRMIGLTEQYHAPAVVQWSLRLPWLPEYLAWVEANYLTRRVWDNDHIIYFDLRIPPGQPIPNERIIRLGDSVALRGYQLEPGPVTSGQDLNLKVYRQTYAPLAEDYTIFTQLLDSRGTQVAGWDSQPLGGYFPTSQWPADEIVTDVVRLPLSADLPSGEYILITGMYRLDTLERLPTTAGDFVSLTRLNVE